MVHTVHSVQHLTDTAFVVRFDRGGIDFEPGQYVTVGIHGDVDIREYSVFSAPSDDYLEILVKLVEGGSVSKRLREVLPGDLLDVEGPFGFFTMPEDVRRTREVLFVATGTGVSPFRSFVRAYPTLRYRLLHGVRHTHELYAKEVFDAKRFVSCVSRGDGGAFRGRVTDYLRSHPAAAGTPCYLCGNCDMIYEAFDILQTAGVEPENLYAEVYF